MIIAKQESVFPMCNILTVERIYVSHMRVNKKYAAIIVIVLSAFPISLYMYWLQCNMHILVHPVAPTVSVQDVIWEIPLAKAELSLYCICYGETVIGYLEVNGTRVDAHPENLSMKNEDSAVIEVYFPFDYNSTYEFRIMTEIGLDYTSVWTSPPPIS